MNEYDELYKKLTVTFCSPVVEMSGDNMSLYDLKGILTREISKYNMVLVGETAATLKHMNSKIRMSRIFRKNIPYIANICPMVSNGDTAVELVFADSEGRYRGEGTITSDNKIFINLLKQEFDPEATMNFLENYKLFFTHCLNSLEAFKNEYSDINFMWNDDYKEKQKTQFIGDGFFDGYFDLERPEKACCTLANLHDLELSRNKHPEYGELYDFVENFNDVYMKRTQININDLNPVFKKIVDVTLENDKKLGKRVVY